MIQLTYSTQVYSEHVQGEETLVLEPSFTRTAHASISQQSPTPLFCMASQIGRWFIPVSVLLPIEATVQDGHLCNTCTYFHAQAGWGGAMLYRYSVRHNAWMPVHGMYLHYMLLSISTRPHLASRGSTLQRHITSQGRKKILLCSMHAKSQLTPYTQQPHSKRPPLIHHTVPNMATSLLQVRRPLYKCNTMVI